ncbi:MAG: DUF1588 domain-containing protein [Planctomycetales bacterium]
MNNVHRNPRFIPAVLLSLAFLGLGAPIPAQESKEHDAKARATALNGVVTPFLKTHCIDCHSADSPEGDVQLDNLLGRFDDRKEAGVWSQVLEALAFSAMPPDSADAFPTSQESRTVQTWIAANLSRHGVPFEDKSRAEGFANLVPHDLLFSSKERQRKVDVAARLWRISPNALIKQMVANIKHRDGVWHINRESFERQMLSRYQFDVNTNPFNLDKPHGRFRDFKGKYLINSMVAEQITELALDAAETQFSAIRGDLEKRKDQGEAAKDSYQHYLTSHFQRVQRMTPSPDEMDALLALANKVDEELGDHQGLVVAMCAVILQPASMFRLEHEASGVGTAALAPRENPDLYALSRRDLSHSLAYALTDLPPDAQLLERIVKDERPIPETLRAEAELLLSDNRFAQRRLLQFFQEYFDYEKAADVFKDDKHRVHWAPAYVSDLNLLIAKVLEEDKQVFKTLLTTNEYRLTVVKSFSGASHLAYNLPADTKRNGDVIKTPKDQRMGVLTHPAWLVAHSGNFDNDPIRRGAWIRTKLLGGMIPDVPITVDAKLPDEPTWTLRKRLEVTEESYCNMCHSKMNPLGLPFERFNHYGRYRRKELGKSAVTTGSIARSGDAALDGDVQDPFEMIQRLARSKRVEQVFVRHVFRFFMGRNETLGDSKTLQDAHTAYVDANGSMKALVVSLLSSDSFIYRASSKVAATEKPSK